MAYDFFKAVLKIINENGKQSNVHRKCHELSEILELKQKYMVREHKILFNRGVDNLAETIVLKLASQEGIDAKKLEFILAPLFENEKINVSTLDEIIFHDFIRSGRFFSGAEVSLFQELGVEGAVNLEDGFPRYSGTELICPQI